MACVISVCVCVCVCVRERERERESEREILIADGSMVTPRSEHECAKSARETGRRRRCLSTIIK